MVWFGLVGLDLNVLKCKVIKFQKSRSLNHFVYHIENSPLDCVDQIKDLGVLLTSNLDFSAHIDNAINKALRMLGFVKRSTRGFSSINAIRTLYYSYVRSHLEYAASVWCPNYACHIHRIEAVQRRFCRYINYKFYDNKEFHYSDLCTSLHLTTLSCRRKQRDLILIQKLINSSIDCPYLTSRIGLHVPSRNTRTIQTFHQQFHRTNYAYHSFIPRTLRLCNELSELDFFGPRVPFVRTVRGLTL